MKTKISVNFPICIVVPLTESDNVIAKIEIEFNQELKKQYPDRTDVNKLQIMEKDQGYKKKLAMRQKSILVKFMEGERKLKLREEMELRNNIEKSVNDKIYTPVQNENLTKKEESKDKMNLTDTENDGENHKKFNWVADNHEQRKKKKYYAEVLQTGYEKEGTFVVKQDINAVMNSATKDIYTVGKVTPHLSKIYEDLLKSEQNSSSLMVNLPPPICTDISTSKVVKSDVCLDEYDKEILSILEDLNVQEMLSKVNHK